MFESKTTRKPNKLVAQKIEIFCNSKCKRKVKVGLSWTVKKVGKGGWHEICEKLNGSKNGDWDILMREFKTWNFERRREGQMSQKK